MEKELIVRNTREEDAQALYELGVVGYGDENMGVTAEKVRSHLKHFPEGQFVVEHNNKIVGSCSSLIVKFDDYGKDHTFNEITGSGYITTHNPEGDTLYGMDVVVHPDYRGKKVGHKLYEARRQLCKKLNLKHIIFGGRMPNYHLYKDELSPEEYVEKVLNGEIKDPVIRFHTNQGFTFKGVIKNYLEKDDESLGYATFMQWDNPDYKE